jgi:hypothetical protein
VITLVNNRSLPVQQMLPLLRALESHTQLLPALKTITESLLARIADPVTADFRLLDSLRGTRTLANVVRSLIASVQAQLAALPPQAPPPAGLVHRLATIASCCSDCASFARHYRNGISTVYVLRAKLSQRNHLQRQIASSGLAAKMTTEQRGSPHSLVVSLPE